SRTSLAQSLSSPFNRRLSYSLLTPGSGSATKIISMRARLILLGSSLSGSCSLWAFSLLVTAFADVIEGLRRSTSQAPNIGIVVSEDTHWSATGSIQQLGVVNRV